MMEEVKMGVALKQLLISAAVYFGIFSFLYFQWFLPTFQVEFLLPAFFTFIGLATIAQYSVHFLRVNSRNKLSYALIGGDPGRIMEVQDTFASLYGTEHGCAGHFGNDYLNGVKHLGNYEDIPAYLNNGCSIDVLLHVDSDLSEKEIQDIVQLCRKKFVSFEALPRENQFFEDGVQSKQVSDLTLLRPKRSPLLEFSNRAQKRLFDIVFSLAVIVFIFPWLYPLIALLIRLESPGPILFKQERSGQYNKPFTCLKFRSMRKNKESDSKQAVRNDARITAIGKILRKTSLDELPQFFNVLKGEMSVVGPRPHMLKHTEMYGAQIETFMIRHEVKPGITGWAQVNGWRGPTDKLYKMIKRVEFDVKYIETWSLWLDIKCIAMTALQVFKIGKNAF